MGSAIPCSPGRLCEGCKGMVFGHSSKAHSIKVNVVCIIQCKGYLFPLIDWHPQCVSGSSRTSKGNSTRPVVFAPWFSQFMRGKMKTSRLACKSSKYIFTAYCYWHVYGLVTMSIVYWMMARTFASSVQTGGTTPFGINGLNLERNVLQKVWGHSAFSLIF